MRKLITALFITIIAVSCFSGTIGQVLAQPSADQTGPSGTPPPLIIRWMRFNGAVTHWETESYHGIITVNAKTANVPPPLFKPWVTVHAVWSNEQRPFDSDTKPVGQTTYTHYSARLVMLRVIRRQEGILVNITGLWNVNKVKITSDFSENGELIKSVREVTPIATRIKGQLLITDNWKKFTLEFESLDALNGVGIKMVTSTKAINPFSPNASPTVSSNDLMQIVRCFKAMPGFGNYNADLDHNKDSKIDLADLTTAAANM